MTIGLRIANGQGPTPCPPVSWTIVGCMAVSGIAGGGGREAGKRGDLARSQSARVVTRGVSRDRPCREAAQVVKDLRRSRAWNRGEGPASTFRRGRTLPEASIDDRTGSIPGA